jgi:hypothetical protein
MACSAEVAMVDSLIAPTPAHAAMIDPGFERR